MSTDEKNSTDPERERSPEQIRAEIEETREGLGDTVAALAGKADVKAQARKKVEETKASAKARASGFTQKAQDATPQDAQDAARQGAQSAQQAVQENPVPAAAIGALLLGFLLGWLIGRRP